MLKVKNKSKLLSIVIAFAMIGTTALTMIPQEADAGIAPPDNEVPSIRIYGECNATYPTQSYTDTWDFVYPSHIDPLDPGIIAKDSITFNPAYLNALYPLSEQVDKAITVDGQDSDEKVYLRLFYEPCYNHSVDQKMEEIYRSGLNPVTFDLGAIVLEYTYMLLDSEGMPTFAHGDADNPQASHFMLPVRSTDDTIPGMEDADMVNLPWVAYNYHAYTNPAITVNPNMQGAINVSQKYTNLAPGATLEFMDHSIEYEGLDVDNKPLFTLSYAGNMPERNENKTKLGVSLYEMNVTWFDRSNGKATMTDQAHRWWTQVTAVRANGNIDLRVGRFLVAGETFYVNGVRYDMPAIHVEMDDPSVGEPVFKYITFQTPIPKGEPYCTDTADWSHVTSQWLKNLPLLYNAWVLPPFNHEHIMIDDIGLEKVDFGEEFPPTPGMPAEYYIQYPDIEIPVTGLILEELKAALDIYYIAETIEPRFNTSLAEIPDYDSWSTDITEYENWTWYNVHTMPTNYTEFVLPNQEVEGEAYTEQYYGNEIPAWYDWDADGAEYLITSSWLAGNSWADDTSPLLRDAISKKLSSYWMGMWGAWTAAPELFPFWDPTTYNGWMQHDIVDRTMRIALPPDLAEATRYFWIPRVVFEFDAENGTDIYINENTPTPSIRVYGDSYLPTRYPNQVWVDLCYRGGENSSDFVYTQLYEPFDPAVIEKDSITFNPAYLNSMYPLAEQVDKAITVDGQDSDEKVHLRLFYQPNYQHPVDALMFEEYPVGLNMVEFDHGAVVLEYTYQLLDSEGMPIFAHGDEDNPQASHFMLPVRSTDDTIPGMEDADMVNLPYVNYSYHTSNPDDNFLGMPPAPYMDGAINVSQKYTNLAPGATLEFMDHSIEYEGLDVDNKPLFTLSYTGNMPERNENKTKLGVSLYEMNVTWFDRSNGRATMTDQAHRWWTQVTAVRANGNIDLRVGRFLVAGETFYVNGVRYDMPAIYVENIGSDSIEPVFKYITFQTPIPKGEPYCTDTPDWSHVTSQWLKNLPTNYDAWVLPPFNHEHIMIDDIGLEKEDFGEWLDPVLEEVWVPDIEIPEMGLILEELKDALSIYYIAETIEPRFNTSLAERFNSTVWSPYTYENLTWYNVYTMPNEYTEFILPDQEVEGEAYTEQYYGNEIPAWYDWDADGAEYLVTSSWMAKNSNTTLASNYPYQKMLVSKPSWDQHDIYNPAMFGGMTLHKEWGGQLGYVPRVTFEFDAFNGTGLYLNGAAGAPPTDWNPWNDDGIITLTELQEAVYYWLQGIPMNGHTVVLSDLQEMVFQWLNP